MLNQFIIDVVETFSEAELAEFDLFVKSPYFNRGFMAEQLTALNTMIVDSKKKGRLSELSKELVYQQLFPGKAVVAGKIDKLTTELKKLLQNFLEIRRYQSEDNDVQRAINQLIDFRQRGLTERYSQTLERIKKQIQNDKPDSILNYQNQLFLVLEEHEWESTFNKGKGNLIIPTVVSALDQYYFAERTMMVNVLLLQGKLTQLTGQSLETVDSQPAIPETILQSSPFILIVDKINQLLRSEKADIQSFEALLRLLEWNEKKIHPIHLSGFYAYLRNICSTLIDTGHYELRPVFHQLQRDNLARGYFYYDGKIPSNAYLNITQIALAVQETSWANDFVESHKDIIIDENETRDFYRMNKALCLFSEKKYEEALDMIPLGSTYSLYHLMARRLELKIYYELDSDLLTFKIDAFKMFISRAGNKVFSENLHELYSNFINVLRQLALTPKIRDKEKADKLIKRINEKKLVAERPWLLEKAREIGYPKR